MGMSKAFTSGYILSIRIIGQRASCASKELSSLSTSRLFGITKENLLCHLAQILVNPEMQGATADPYTTPGPLSARERARPTGAIRSRPV
jgi:hypothetical protein